MNFPVMTINCVPKCVLVLKKCPQRSIEATVRIRLSALVMESKHQKGIAQFFAKRSVFLTGVTGFIGKVVIEKLLRSCPDVEYIYVLVRDKLNRTPCERLDEILLSELFLKVREFPHLTPKVICVRGDVTLDGLGISREQTKTLWEKVSVVLHVAANVKFAAGLDNLLNVNTGGTKNVIEWSKKIRNLKAFVYMSTAFSNSGREEILERVYPIDIDPHVAIKLYSDLPSELVDSFASKLIGTNKLYYTFSKHLAETLVQEARVDLPVCIVRPAIVTAAQDEPFPGWIDNFNGMGGLLVGIAKGLVRCVYVNKRGTLDIVPVDHVVNLTLAAAYRLGTGEKTYQDGEIKVYNCSSTEHPYVYKEVYHAMMEAFEETPFAEMVWYPSVVYVRNRLAFAVFDFFLHYIPALLVDTIRAFTRKKSKVKMLDIYKKSHQLANVLEAMQRTYYSISTENTKALYKSLNSEDQNNFKFDITEVNWKDYIRQSLYGYRRYVCKERDEDLPVARMKFQRFKKIYIAMWVLQLLIVAFYGILLVFPTAM